MNEQEQQLHEFRKEIDALIQKANKGRQGYKPGENVYVREMSLAHTKLQEAKMWVGKCLEALGTPFPKELRDKAE